MVLRHLVDPAYFQLIALNLYPTATITEGRTYSVIWCFVFHSAYMLTGSPETIKVEPTWPKCPPLPSLLWCPPWFRALSFSTSLRFNSLDPLLFCTGDVAELCIEVTLCRVTSMQSNLCIEVTLHSYQQRNFFLPSLGSFQIAPTVYRRIGSNI